MAGLDSVGAAAPALASGSNLGAGSRLSSGQSLVAGEYQLVMQTDGNLVLYHLSTPVWSSYTYHEGAFAAMQADGNFVVYSSGGTPVWFTSTNGSGASTASLQSDGNFVLYGSSAVWATGTNGGTNQLRRSHAMAQAEKELNAYDYVFGGGHGAIPGPTLGGLDCSGFARWMYSYAWGSDVLGAGATTSEITLVNRVSSPVPGDLVFFGSSTGSVHHVGIYIGNNHMINALHSGTRIEQDTVSSLGDFFGYYRY